MFQWDEDEGLMERIRHVSRNLWARLKQAAYSISTSFIGLHYVYIILWSIVISVILYGERNIAYIDALFQGVSAMTITGLNTVNMNNLKLYQQIFLFIPPIFTHPLTVNYALVLWHLTVMERQLTDVNELSKLQSRVRRTHTWARDADVRPPPVNEALDLGTKDDEDNSSKTNQRHPSATEAASGSDEGNEEKQNQPEDRPNHQNNRDIRFGSLPVPHHERNPHDMYRSLNMMQHAQRHDDMDEDDGPALVIKSPQDIEAEEAQGIRNVPVYTTHNDSDGDSMVDENDEADDRRMNERSNSFTSNTQPRDFGRTMTARYLSWQPTVGRNSAFVGLSSEQREELGGIEYRALLTLLWLIPSYVIIVIVLPLVMLLAWTYSRGTYREMIFSNGINPAWFSFSIAFSAFNNCGLSLIPASIEPFNASAYVPLVLSFLIFAGSVGVPILFRLYIRIIFNCCPYYGRLRETLGFVLDHPRRFFMLLFPFSTTIKLGLTLLAMVTAEITLYMILNTGVHSPDQLPSNYRLLTAWFQSISSRTAGLTSITISKQHPAVLAINILSMYIAIYPVAMSIRQSNVYEEQTLGTFYFEDDEGRQHRDEARPPPLIDHIRRQLGSDLWGFAFAFVLIAITEGGPITRNEFSLFDVLYEVSSAYGTVGFSMGYGSLSLSGGFSKLGKLIIIFVMVRSRHRALPYKVDRAILLKHKDLRSRDKEQEGRVRNPQKMANPSEGQPSILQRAGTTVTSRLRTAGTLRSRRTMSSRNSARNSIHRQISA